MSNNGKVLLVGTGEMAKEYVKILCDLKCDYIIVGNSVESVENFRDATGQDAISGGVFKFINDRKEDMPGKAIVAVNPDALYDVTKSLVKAGVKKILVEKPGVISVQQARDLVMIAKEFEATIYVGYNRRYYNAVREARRIIDEDGGIESFSFEFTEWSDQIKELNYTEELFNKWFLLNSSHVVDLAFWICGKPKEITSYVCGELPWHAVGKKFVGAGITIANIPFSYQANWDAPGRWKVEILTQSHRLYLCPMEKLQVQDRNKVVTYEVEYTDEWDNKYKPGLYREILDFINEGNSNTCCLIEEQCNNLEIYSKISGEKY